MIPLLEFPTNTSTWRKRLKYITLPRLAKIFPRPWLAMNDLVRSIKTLLPASAFG